MLCTFVLVITVFAACDGEMDRKFKHTGPLLPLSIGMAALLGKSRSLRFSVIFCVCVFEEQVYLHIFVRANHLTPLRGVHGKKTKEETHTVYTTRCT